MKERRGHIVLSGGRGLVGGHLRVIFRKEEVLLLSRAPFSDAKEEVVVWGLGSDQISADCLAYAKAVLHLAGAPVATRVWTRARRKVLWNSRVNTTKLLVERMGMLDSEARPSVFICASAIGYYPYGFSAQGEGDEGDKGRFLSDLVSAWEAEALKARALGIRVVIFRFGHVLSTQGGLFPPLLWSVQRGVGVVLGSGAQMMSWIHIYDLMRLLSSAISDIGYEGVYNATAPHPISLHDMMVSLSKGVGRRLLFSRFPGVILRCLLGEMSQLFLRGQVVLPRRAISERSFSFTFSTFESAMKDLLSSQPSYDWEV